MVFSRSLLKVTQWVSLTVLFAALALAQSERGTITGAVRDPSGASVPAATVIITNQATNVAVHVTTNDAGEFTVPNLPPGTYLVRVEKGGFRPSEERGLSLDAAQTVRADAILQVGTSNQAIEVQASAVSLQTEDAKSSTTLQNKLVNDLPLVVSGTVRTPFDLAAMTPDAKNVGGDNGFIGRRRSGGRLRHHARRCFREHVARVVEKLGRLQLPVRRGDRSVHRRFQRLQSGIWARCGRHDLRIQVRHQRDSTARPTSLFAITISTPITFSATPPASPIRFISRTISASQPAVRSGFPRSITGRTRRFSSSPTKVSATAPAPTVRPSPSPLRKCTTAISANGLPPPGR